MPRIIVTSRYIKNPKFSKAGKLVKYMGTREGVEKIPNGIDNSPATKKQEQLINSIAKHYPDTKDYLEYKDYVDKPTKSNATEFIDSFIERNADRTDELKSLVTYIAERSGVEKLGSHGLFSQTDDKINLNDVADEVDNHDGIVWTHVISLNREDAERLGYNNADAWKKLVRRNVNEIAEAHKINVSDMEWYAAFHNTTHHPHIHLMVYSKSGQGYLTNKGIESMRSTFGNDIFRNEQYKIFKMQNEIREDLKNEVNDLLDNVFKNSLNNSDNQQVIELMFQLQNVLKNTKGKKIYGYLSKDVKKTVNEILVELAKNESISKLYSKWNELNKMKLSLYYDKDNGDIPIEDNKEFQSIKNAIIRAVMKTNFDLPKNDYSMSSAGTTSTGLVMNLAKLIADSCNLKIDNLNHQAPKQVEHKQLTKIQEKKIAHGQRIDEVVDDYNNDEEEIQTSGFGLFM
jgi:hypothetical protein